MLSFDDAMLHNKSLQELKKLTDSSAELVPFFQADFETS
jgi:hypothetical protein